MVSALDRPRFDYKALALPDRQYLSTARSNIHQLVSGTAQCIVEIGVTLMNAKGRIPHGQFEDWAECELPWSLSQTKRLIYVGEAFAGRKVEQFAPSALYVLAWPGVPQQAREYAFEKAEDGEEISHEDAKEILAMYKPAAVPPGTEPAKRASLRDEPKREDLNPMRRDAESWRKFERLMAKMGTIHIMKLGEDADVSFTITCYPDDDDQPMANYVRGSMDELVAAAIGETTLKKCPRCERSLPRDKFANDMNSADGKNRSCKDCERVRTAGRVRK